MAFLIYLCVIIREYFAYYSGYCGSLKGDVLEKDRKVVLNYQHFERLIQVTQQ
jgi:hypothetical protein